MIKKLSTLTKIIYGFGDIGFSMTGTIIAAYFPIFLTDVVGIAPAMAALALLIGKNWDYINQPSQGSGWLWGQSQPFCCSEGLSLPSFIHSAEKNTMRLSQN